MINPETHQPRNLQEEIMQRGMESLSQSLQLDQKNVGKTISSLSNPDELADTVINLAIDKGADFVGSKFNVNADLVKTTAKVLRDPENTLEQIELASIAMDKGSEYLGNKLGLDPKDVRQVLEDIRTEEGREHLVETLSDKALKQGTSVLETKLRVKPGKLQVLLDDLKDPDKTTFEEKLEHVADAMGIDPNKMLNQRNVFLTGDIIDPRTHKPYTPEERLKSNVLANLAFRVMSDEEAVRKIEETIADQFEFADVALEIAADKGVEYVSEAYGIDAKIVKSSLKIFKDPDEAMEEIKERGEEKAWEQAQEKVWELFQKNPNSLPPPTAPIPKSPLDILMGPKGESSGKYVNMPWGNTFGEDIFKAPKEGWNWATIKDRSMKVGEELLKNSKLNLGLGNYSSLADKAIEAIKGSGGAASEVVQKLITDRDLKGLKVATTAAMRIGVDQGLLKSVGSLSGGAALPVVALISDLAVNKTDQILHRTTDALIDHTIGKSIVVSCTTIGRTVGQKGGAVVGAAIGSVLGPVGTAIGTVAGATWGWLGGAAIGTAISTGVKKLAHVAVEGVKSVVKTVSKAVSSVGSFVGRVASGAWSAVKSVGSAICSFFGF